MNPSRELETANREMFTDMFVAGSMANANTSNECESASEEGCNLCVVVKLLSSWMLNVRVVSFNERDVDCMHTIQGPWLGRPEVFQDRRRGPCLKRYQFEC